MTITPSIRPRIVRRAAISSSVSEWELESRRCRPCLRAPLSIPRMTSEKNSPNRSGRSTPIAWARLVMRLRATPFGQKLSRAATPRTCSRVASLTTELSLKTRDTVATETPAARATSLILAMRVEYLAGRWGGRPLDLTH